jgi:hypothetical protein
MHAARAERVCDTFPFFILLSKEMRTLISSSTPRAPLTHTPCSLDAFVLVMMMTAFNVNVTVLGLDLNLYVAVAYGGASFVSSQRSGEAV